MIFTVRCKCLTFRYLLLFFIPHFAYTQTLKIQQSIPIQTPFAVSIDKNQQIFIADSKGNIQRYDSTGKYNLHFSPLRLAIPQLIEAWQTQKIFAFYPDFQSYILLDRFLNQTFSFDFSTTDKIGFVRVATLAADNSIWLLDNQDFSLKKYNTDTDRLIVHTSLDLLLNPENYDINYLREYQNKLFINDKNTGILIFDILGNFKKILPYKNLTYFSFFENTLYFLHENSILLIDLYKNQEIKIPLPKAQKWRFALFQGTKIIAFTEEKMVFFQNE